MPVRRELWGRVLPPTAVGSGLWIRHEFLGRFWGGEEAAAADGDVAVGCGGGREGARRREVPAQMRREEKTCGFHCG
jgi:hypothetical protein